MKYAIALGLSCCLFSQPAEAQLTAGSTLSPNVLYQETFEGEAPLSTYVKRQFVAPHSFTVAGSPVFNGLSSGRLELRDTDPMNNNGTRAEISFPKQAVQDRWYVFSAYFPASDFAYDTKDEVICQWYQGLNGYSSSIALRVRQDKFRLTVIPYKGAQSEKIDFAPVAKDMWITFAFHIKHSSGPDGLIELWMNGTKVLNRPGSNMYDLASDPEAETPNWKLGIYKSAWNDSNTSDVSRRVLYLDDIKLGNENATLEEMTSMP